MLMNTVDCQSQLLFRQNILDVSICFFAVGFSSNGMQELSRSPKTISAMIAPKCWRMRLGSA